MINFSFHLTLYNLFTSTACNLHTCVVKGCEGKSFRHFIDVRGHVTSLSTLFPAQEPLNLITEPFWT